MLARNGTRPIAVAPHRGDEAWDTNRMDFVDILNVVQDTSALEKSLLINKIPAILSTEEPCMRVGKRTRYTVDGVYYKGVIKDFVTALKECVQNDVGFELVEKDAPGGTSYENSVSYTAARQVMRNTTNQMRGNPHWRIHTHTPTISARIPTLHTLLRIEGMAQAVAVANYTLNKSC
ncbi:unnamed protein product [Heligmosomoides polygyrus]|uniref:NAD(P)-bd_dom domain-containing protein n=1 Tax=Heligmosomoides polygyrus TaxID=6339 RepID=A0A183GAK1_HELPZ|nr:unnamed protein product [Heligmosomoides polygyrus]